MRNTAILVLILSAWTLGAQAQPRFEVDTTWPQPLPEGWIFAQIGGVCVDSHDHIAIVDRSNITDEEKQTNIPTPTFVMFDSVGEVGECFAGVGCHEGDDEHGFAVVGSRGRGDWVSKRQVDSCSDSL